MIRAGVPCGAPPAGLARVHVHLPDELVHRAREAGLDLSAVAREALARELRTLATPHRPGADSTREPGSAVAVVAPPEP